MAIASAKATDKAGTEGVSGVAVSTRPSFGKRLRASWKAYLFIAPAMIILFVFHFFPIVYAFFLSLYRQISAVKGIVPPSENFAGFENYGRLLADPDWWNAFFNTLGYVIGAVFFGLAAALGISLLLDKVKKGKAIYRVAFFLPYVTSLVAVATIWYTIFGPFAPNALVKANPNKPGGLMNWLFSSVGIPMQRWLIDDTGIFRILFDNGGRVDAFSLIIRLVATGLLIGAIVLTYRSLPQGVGEWISGILTAAAIIVGYTAFLELAHGLRWEWLAGWAEYCDGSHYYCGGLVRPGLQCGGAFGRSDQYFARIVRSGSH